MPVHLVKLVGACMHGTERLDILFTTVARTKRSEVQISYRETNSDTCSEGWPFECTYFYYTIPFPHCAESPLSGNTFLPNKEINQHLSNTLMHGGE